MLHQSEILAQPWDVTQARQGIDRWRTACLAANIPPDALLSHPGGRALLSAITGNSPFLTDLLVKHPALPVQLWERGIDAVWQQVLPEQWPLPGPNNLKREVRLRRQQVALLVALADLAGMWTGEQVIRALSDFAGAAVSLVLEQLLTNFVEQGQLSPGQAARLQDDCGYTILGMGKLGAGELNYSSDIDLVIFYDPERVRARDPDRIQPLMVKLTRQLVDALEDRTPDGYVFRVDLRLRPDPGSTPPALSLGAAEVYYTSLAQTWERAAMIKARPIAGDIAVGNQFLKLIQPFVWRRHLDFAAIAEVHAIKQQINSHRGFGQIHLPGHNIKLGAGGIREIEFFAQTQQLIWGGRDPSLRCPRTMEALDALAASGHIDLGTAADLHDSYYFLRQLEHRLQMVQDAQTHTLPETEEGLAHIAAFAGFPGVEAFKEATLHHLHRVDAIYEQLFRQPEQAQTKLVAFSSDDSTLIARLGTMGFSEPQQAAQRIADWHTGRRRVTRGERARQLLQDLTPALVQALVATGNPDQALLNFDNFLSKLASGVQLFSLLSASTTLLQFVAEIMGEAPSLASRLAVTPGLLDNVLTLDPARPFPARQQVIEDLAAGLQPVTDYEDKLRYLREQVQDRQFRIGVPILQQSPQAPNALRALSDLADAAILALLPVVHDAFRAVHGTFSRGGLCVLALGKHGGQEMTVNSDLDLIFVYDAPEGEQSDGLRPLSPAAYYGRLAQRMVSALTAPVADGTLYQVDMRLRPSGNAGPVAASLESFIRYHDESAWTWEHLALTRCRVIDGPADLHNRLEREIHAVLTRPRDVGQLLADVREMHGRVVNHHKARDIWHMKHARGGMMDIEFLAQTLQLQHGHLHPGILCRNTVGALRKLTDAGFLPADEGRFLTETQTLWQAMQSLMRLCIGSTSPEGRASDNLKRKLCRLADAPDFARLRGMVQERQERSYAVVQKTLSP